MKRNGFMKDYTSTQSCANNNKNHPTTKDHFSHVSNSYNNSNIINADYEEYVNGFPWPPRSYTCSFCRKEFKSAQALGGHMNVHRRDRARLRQQSPPTQAQAQGPLLNLNLNPNNNNSTSSSSTTTLKPLVTCTTLPLFVSPTTATPAPSAPSSHELNKRLIVVDGILLNPFSTNTKITSGSKSKIPESFSAGVGEYDDHHHHHAFPREDGCNVLKKGEILRMDLEIGLPRGYDLDLELRLGTTYS